MFPMVNVPLPDAKPPTDAARLNHADRHATQIPESVVRRREAERRRDLASAAGASGMSGVSTIRFEHPDKMRVALEGMMAFASRVRLEFTPDALCIVGHDTASTVIVANTYPRERVCESGGEFTCDQPSHVVIETRHLPDVLRAAGLRDFVELSLDAANPLTIHVIVSNNRSGLSEEWDVSTCNERMGAWPALPPFCVQIKMASVMLHDCVRKLAQTHDSRMRFVCNGQGLVMSSSGDALSTSLDVPGVEVTANSALCANISWPIVVTLHANYLTRVIKPKNICTDVVLSLSPNMPARIEYPGLMCQLCYVITPFAPSAS